MLVAIGRTAEIWAITTVSTITTVHKSANIDFQFHVTLRQIRSFFPNMVIALSIQGTNVPVNLQFTPYCLAHWNLDLDNGDLVCEQPALILETQRCIMTQLPLTVLKRQIFSWWVSPPGEQNLPEKCFEVGFRVSGCTRVYKIYLNITPYRYG